MLSVEERADRETSGRGDGEARDWVLQLQDMQLVLSLSKETILALCTACLLKGRNPFGGMTMLDGVYRREVGLLMIELRAAGLCYRSPPLGYALTHHPSG